MCSDRIILKILEVQLYGRASFIPLASINPQSSIFKDDFPGYIGNAIDLLSFDEKFRWCNQLSDNELEVLMRICTYLERLRAGKDLFDGSHNIGRRKRRSEDTSQGKEHR